MMKYWNVQNNKAHFYNTETKTEKLDETPAGVTPRLISKESNRRANERKKEASQAKGNVIGLIDEIDY